ncbi:MAG: MarR family winged helix-turn-helix transcriptional regulator [Bacteroidota bacterium]
MANAHQLNSSELELLLILAHTEEDLSIKHISQRMMLCSQAITKISRSLHNSELVKFEKSSEDRRVTFVKLTPQGLDVVAEERRAREQALQEAINALADQEGRQSDGEAVHRPSETHESIDLERATQAYVGGGGAFSPSFLADSLSQIASHITKTNL